MKDQCENIINYFLNGGHKINESFINNDNNMTNDNNTLTNDNNNITNDNDFISYLNYIKKSFYLLPITNKEIINTILNMKYKSYKEYK